MQDPAETVWATLQPAWGGRRRGIPIPHDLPWGSWDLLHGPPASPAALALPPGWLLVSPAQPPSRSQGPL